MKAQRRSERLKPRSKAAAFHEHDCGSTSLKNTCFDDAELKDVQFEGVNLQGVSLTNATVDSGNFVAVIANQADFTDAKFHGVGRLGLDGHPGAKPRGGVVIFKLTVACKVTIFVTDSWLDPDSFQGVGTIRFRPADGEEFDLRLGEGMKDD